MLNQIRSSVAGWTVKILMGVLIASFAMWGVTDFLRVAPDSVVAEVGEQEITVQEYHNNFQRQLQALQQRFGNSLTAEQARQFGLADQVLQQMVAQALIDSAVRDMQLTANDDAVAAAIRANPSFQSTVGGFDRFRYEDILRANGYTEAAFVEITRQEMARNQLFDALTGGISAPKTLAEAAYLYQSEKRRIETLTIPYADMTDVTEANDSDITAYHSENKDRFMAPEYRRITYLTLQPEDLLDEVSATEEEVKAEFESRRHEFVSEETRAVEQLLLGDKANAEKAAAAIKSKDDFYKIAKAMGGFESEDVKLGTVKKSGLPEEVRDIVFALPLNQLSAPVEGPFGWVLYRVTEITPGSEKGFAEVRGEIERDVKLQHASDAIYDLSTRLEDSLAGGASLEETANVGSLTVKTVTAVDARGMDKAGKPVEGLPASAHFLATIFDTDANMEPTLNEFEDGGYFLIRVDEIVDPALRPVNEVKTEIASLIRVERQEAAARKLAEELTQKANAGTTFAGLAGDEGWPIATTEMETRATMIQNGGVGPDLLEALFTTDKSRIVFGADNRGEGQVIARVVDIEAGKVAGAETEVARIQENLANSMINDLLNQYRVALEGVYGVDIDNNAIEAVFAPPSQ